MRKWFPKTIWLLPISLICMLTARISPKLSSLWGKRVVEHYLSRMDFLNSSAGFSLLEFTVAGILMALLFLFVLDLFRRKWFSAIGRLCKRLLSFMLMLLLGYSLLWYPLYFAGDESFQSDVSLEQLEASCRKLISELNAAPLDFSALPGDLPAKYARFPFWMRATGITGFYSFYTGEAFLSPDLNPAAVPFVAVHEHTHAAGIAQEGETNIAAYEACLKSGGSYADSARLWALKYSMAVLREMDSKRWAICAGSMSARTEASFSEIGGWNLPLPREDDTPLQAAFGIRSKIMDYENLAVYLAAQIPI